METSVMGAADDRSAEMTSDARQTVVHRLAELFTVAAGERALQFEDAWWTWGDLGGVHSALAATMSDRAVVDSACVAVVMRQRPAMVAAELSVLAAGRTVLQVTPLQADRSLHGEIVSLAPAVIVAHAKEWARPGFAEAVEQAGSLGLEVTDRLDVVVNADGMSHVDGPSFDAAVTVLTSGTTGPPKRLPVTWQSFVAMSDAAPGRPARSDRGALILSVPLATIGGVLTLSRLVFGGRPMALMERFDVHVWAALVKEHRPKVIGAPPPVVKMVLDAGISPDHFDGVSAYRTASAPLPPSIAAEFHRRYGVPVLLGYGATEFLDSVTGWPPGLWEEFGATKLGSVGRPHPGVRVRVVDAETGMELPVGDEGILEVDSPQRASDLPPGWMRTADRARVDEDGFVWILGRTDDVIVRGGFKVDLAMVEATLRDHPSVEQTCVVGLRDERLGHVPAAMVVLRDAQTSAGELVEWLRERVPPYAVPTVVRVADAIPQTSTLKPQRREVERLLQDVAMRRVEPDE